LFIRIIIFFVSIALAVNLNSNGIMHKDSTKVFALVNCLLINGTGNEPIENATIIIRDNLIEFSGKSLDAPIPDNAEIIDLKGATALPGFINTHVHQDYNDANLKKWAAEGVTTVRDLGVREYTPDTFSKRDILSSDVFNARLLAAGPIVTTVNGYGTMEVTSPGDAEDKVNNLLENGADLVKIAIEDNLQMRTFPLLTEEEIKTIVNTAHKNDTKVSAHISRTYQIAMAISGGVDDLAHMAVDEVSDSIIINLVTENIYWVPTLELWKEVSDMYELDWFDIAKNNLKKFVSAGGKVALGTDYAGYITPFDLGMPIREILWMKDAGMTPMQIIVSATKNSAFICNLQDILGTLESGKIADVLVVNGNPLVDLNTLANTKMVIHNGVVIVNK